MVNPVYRNSLFLPFTDETTGELTYGGGRYIDLDIKDIKNNKIIIDFNKALDLLVHIKRARNYRVHLS